MVRPTKRARRADGPSTEDRQQGNEGVEQGNNENRVRSRMDIMADVARRSVFRSLRCYATFTFLAAMGLPVDIELAHP